MGALSGKVSLLCVSVLGLRGSDNNVRVTVRYCHVSGYGASQLLRHLGLVVGATCSMRKGMRSCTVGKAMIRDSLSRLLRNFAALA